MKREYGKLKIETVGAGIICAEVKLHLGSNGAFFGFGKSKEEAVGNLRRRMDGCGKDELLEEVQNA